MIKNNIQYNEAQYNKVKNAYESALYLEMVKDTDIPKGFWSKAIVQDFQKWNFYSLGFENLVSKGQSKGQTINQRTIDKCIELFLTEYKRLTLADIFHFIYNDKDYDYLKLAVIKRLEQTFNAFKSEEYKIYECLAIANRLKIKLKIVASDTLDRLIGVDFYCVLENELALAVHSTSGTQSASANLERKQTKYAYLELQNGTTTYDRAKEYNLANHINLKDIDNQMRDKNVENKIKNIQKQCSDIIDTWYVDTTSENVKSKSIQEFTNVLALINKLKEKETVNIYTI